MAFTIQPLVLVVEPHPEHRRVVTQVLNQTYCVVGAGNLAEADAALRSFIPTLIIVEVDEPDGDGLLWIRRVRGDAELHRGGIVCVSSRAQVQDKIAAFYSGADDFHVKPIVPETFLTRMILLQRIRELSPGQRQ